MKVREKFILLSVIIMALVIITAQYFTKNEVKSIA